MTTDERAPRDVSGSPGVSIRPHALHFSPLYRRARDSILRPHLRLTESRYFWEKWKPRLGPDATVLIMEVRDRCNRALTGQGSAGATVSAADLAAACGFSRVTLWRLLQREDVRRFVRVEHNYVYDRRIGKKRRTISTYHVLMEDPLLEEDEPLLERLLEASSFSSGADVTPAHASSRPTLHSETEVVDNSRPTFPSESTKGGSSEKPQNVLKTTSKERLPRTTERASSPAKPGGAQPARLGDLLAQIGGHNGSDQGSPTSDQPMAPTVDRRYGAGGTGGVPSGQGERRRRTAAAGGEATVWDRYPELARYVEEAELLLEDHHSRGFYVNALKRLYPGHMAIWQRALVAAREQKRIKRSRGALFTRLLRTFAADAGVEL